MLSTVLSVILAIIGVILCIVVLLQPNRAAGLGAVRCVYETAYRFSSINIILYNSFQDIYFSIIQLHKPCLLYTSVSSRFFNKLYSSFVKAASRIDIIACSLSQFDIYCIPC